MICGRQSTEKTCHKFRGGFTLKTGGNNLTEQGGARVHGPSQSSGEGGGETNSYIHSQKKKPETPRGASVREEKKEERR